MTTNSPHGFYINPEASYTVADLAQLLGVSKQSVWRHIRNGVLPPMYGKRHSRVRFMEGRALIEALKQW